MRVCQIIESSSGGSVQVALDLTRYLVGQGDDVTFIYSPLRADDAFFQEVAALPSVKFIPLPMQRAVGFHDLQAGWRLWRLLKRAGPFDVLHAHSSKAGGLMRLASLFLPRTVRIYTPHAFITMSPGASWIYGVAEYALSYLCEAIVPVSETEKEHAVQKLRLSMRKLHVVPNGIAFEEEPSRAQARQTLGLGENDFVIGFVGRLVAQKNPLRLVEAFSLLAAETPLARLVIVGNGDLLPATLEAVAQANLSDRVVFCTNHRARALMPAFDALCCSSDYEGIPVSFLEALTEGVPIVTTPVGGTQETVVPGQTGLVADDFSASALGARLRALASLSHAEKTAMREAARRHGALFSIERMGRSMRDLYVKLVRNLSLIFFLIFLSTLPATAMPWPIPPTVGGGMGVQIKGGLVSDTDLRRIKEMGFGFVRFSAGWQGLEPQRGVYDWRELDALIARVRAANLKMVIPLLGGHAAYNGWVEAPKKNTDRVKRRPRAPETPEARTAFARLAAQAAVRYPGQDIVWEIWNEPDLARFWPPKADAAAYAALAQETCALIKSVAPGSHVIGPGLGRVPDSRDGITPDYLGMLLASPAAHCFDAISLHPYRHGAEVPEGVFGDYETVFPLLARNKVSAPLLDTEWGYATAQITTKEQADFILRARFSDMLWGIPLSIWYEWRDSRTDPTDLESHFGLTLHDGRDKPVVAFLESLLPIIKDARLEQQVHTVDPRDMLIMLQDKSGSHFLIGWTLREASAPKARVTRAAGFNRDLGTLTATPRLLAIGGALSAKDFAIREGEP